MATKIKSGSITLDVSDPFQKQIKKLVDRIAPDIEDIIRGAVEEVYKYARDEWIVKTGFSRDALSQEVRYIATQGKLQIVGLIRNSAPYAYQIKVASLKKSKNASGGETIFSKDDHLWSVAVREPIERKVEEIKPAIEAALTGLED